jgi:hypothetical protein
MFSAAFLSPEPTFPRAENNNTASEGGNSDVKTLPLFPTFAEPSVFSFGATSFDDYRASPEKAKPQPALDFTFGGTEGGAF